MQEYTATLDDDLRVAATIVLRGPQSAEGTQLGPADVDPRAVDRVARTLRERGPLAVDAIRGAVAQYRRDRSWRSEVAVIEAVTTGEVSDDGPDAVPEEAGPRHG